MTELMDNVADIKAESGGSEDKKYRLDGSICQNRILLIVFRYYTKANLHISNLAQIERMAPTVVISYYLFHLHSFKYPLVCSVMPLAEVIAAVFPITWNPAFPIRISRVGTVSR